MADPLAEKAAVPAAVLEKGAAKAGAKPVEQAGAQIRAKMEGESPRSALESLREIKAIAPLEQKAIDQKLKDSIGTEIKPDGSKNLNTAEQARFDRAKENAKLAKDYLDKGYDQMSDVEKNRLRMPVMAVLNSWPEANAVLSCVTPAEREQIVADILRNPAYMAKMKGSFEGVLAIDIQDLVTAAKEKHDQANDAEAANIKELTGNKTEIQDNDTALEDYALKTGGVKGKKLDELDKITADVPKLNTEISGFETKRKDKKDDVRRLTDSIKAAQTADPTKDVTGLETQLATARTELHAIEAEINSRQKQIGRKTELETEKASLEQKKVELEAKRVELETKKIQLESERIKAGAELASIQLDRASSEQDFVDGLYDVFSDAAMEHIIAEGEKAETAQQALLAEAKKNAKDPAEVALLDQMQKRWDKDIKTLAGHGRKTTAPNKEQIEADLGTLVTAGPDAVISDMLAAGGMNPPEIKAKLADAEFMTKYRAEIAKRIITKRITTNSLTENEAAKIAESDWGTAAIQNAINKKAEIIRVIEQLQSKGAVREGSDLLKIAKEHKGVLAGGTSLLMALLLLLFSPVAAGAVGATGAVIMTGKILGGITKNA
jgi:hypothetical protein